MTTFGLDIRSGWTLIADASDLMRWMPESIMPTIKSLIDIADKTVSVPAVAASDEYRIGVKDRPDCVAILLRYPANRLGIKGHVWIGLKAEAETFWREYKADGHALRFKLNLPSDIELN